MIHMQRIWQGVRSFITKIVVQFRNFFTFILAFSKTLLQKIKALPGWLLRRPAAIKHWWKENKKKRKYHSFKLEKRLQPEPREVPTSWRLTKQSVQFFLKYFWVFFGAMLLQFAVYMLFVHGPTDFNLTNVQETIKSFFGNDTHSAASTFALLGTVIGAQTQRSGAAAFNFVIYLSMSLAYIWMIRALSSKKPFRLRDAFYNGMTPVIPVIIILLTISVQLLPFTIASYIYTVGRTQGVFISGLEDLVFFLIALACGLLSFCWITPSVIAIYGVTLPNMYPLHTITLTRQIIKYRRLQVFRRVIALPIIIALLFFALLLLLLRLYPQGGIWFVQLFPIFVLPLIHIYLFKLYKALI